VKRLDGLVGHWDRVDLANGVGGVIDITASSALVGVLENQEAGGTVLGLQQ
jgi:hypothetical protein